MWHKQAMRLIPNQLCKLTLDEKLKTLDDLPKVKDLATIDKLDGFESFASFVLLHEVITFFA